MIYDCYKCEHEWTDININECPKCGSKSFSGYNEKILSLKKLWRNPLDPPKSDRDVLVKVEVDEYEPMYKVCHYENGKWWHLFRGYQINPQECPWVITGWRDIN